MATSLENPKWNSAGALPAHLHGGLGIVVIIQKSRQSLDNGSGIWGNPVEAASWRLHHQLGFARRAVRQGLWA